MLHEIVSEGKDSLYTIWVLTSCLKCIYAFLGIMSSYLKSCNITYQSTKKLYIVLNTNNDHLTEMLTAFGMTSIRQHILTCNWPMLLPLSDM
jgi:hypothetical protein